MRRRWSSSARPALRGFRFGLESAGAHCFGELVQHGQRVLPAEAAVGDAHTVLERLAGNEVLAARLQVALHHDTENALVACGNLPRYVVPDVDLLLRILAAVGVAEI